MLRAASRLGNYETVKELINSGANLQSCDGVIDMLPLSAHVYASNCVVMKVYIQ